MQSFTKDVCYWSALIYMYLINEERAFTIWMKVETSNLGKIAIHITVCTHIDYELTHVTLFLTWPVTSPRPSRIIWGLCHSIATRCPFLNITNCWLLSCLILTKRIHNYVQNFNLILHISTKLTVRRLQHNTQEKSHIAYIEVASPRDKKTSWTYISIKEKHAGMMTCNQPHYNHNLMWYSIPSDTQCSPKKSLFLATKWNSGQSGKVLGSSLNSSSTGKASRTRLSPPSTQLSNL